MQLWLFLIGLAAGSFLNVIALRYDPDRFILNKQTIGGRSYCPDCKNKLNWFELVPLLSFIFLRGRCRNCRAKISWQYPIVEIISGLIFILVPIFLKPTTYYLNFQIQNPIGYWLLAIGFILIFEILLLVTLIDIRLKLIPDEANILLVILGIFIILLSAQNFDFTSGSFLGSYAALFGFRGNIWVNHSLAAFFGAAFFLILFLITLGRGMGLGDLKFAFALGFVFGWPDIILITALAFILGSLFSLPGLILKKRRLKSFLPFGPFLALASLVVFFFGHDLVKFYFGLFTN